MERVWLLDLELCLTLVPLFTDCGTLDMLLSLSESRQHKGCEVDDLQMKCNHLCKDFWNLVSTELNASFLLWVFIYFFGIIRVWNFTNLGHISAVWKCQGVVLSFSCDLKRMSVFSNWKRKDHFGNLEGQNARLMNEWETPFQLSYVITEDPGPERTLSQIRAENLSLTLSSPLLSIPLERAREQSWASVLRACWFTP